jgi:hypothetical protein
MKAKGSGLAARLRAAVERAEADRADQQAEAERVVHAARAAADGLFDDLAAFGQQLPFLSTERASDRVTLRRDDRHLTFTSDEEGRVTLTFTGIDARDTHVVYREAALGDRWIWVRSRGARQDRLPLFDQGLEVLLVHALDLPDPDLPAPAAPPTDDADRKRSL